jgi:voltage-dependent potassium channel beta subunit
MEYRRLGRSGLQVSELSVGSWVTYGSQVDQRAARESLAAAYDAGINFFDNAEAYAAGESESIMGRALKELAYPRANYVVSTKFYWGLENRPNRYHTLNRKYLLDAIDGSLKRLQLDYVDLAFCHRPDPNTPIEETVWAMSDMVTRGKALYWGTSEWSAEEIRAAYEIAERHHLHKPVMEQPQYNLFHRKRVETEYARLYEDYGLGLTTWSPLASGLLTGKYRNGIPEGSRAQLQGYDWLQKSVLDAKKNEIVGELETIATSLGASVGTLALAWVLKNPNVSTVITGSSRIEQLHENLKAAELAKQITPEIQQKIEDAVGENFA